VIQVQLKLRLTGVQERRLLGWLRNLTKVWNWGIKKIETNAKARVCLDGTKWLPIYYSQMDFQNLLAGHSTRMGVPSHVMQGMLVQAHKAWQRCFEKISKKPKLKGFRNRLNSIPFPDPIKSRQKNRISLPGIGSLKFHAQLIPAGKIKCARVVRRASGWYLCLFIDAESARIPHKAEGRVGIDPGFKHLLTLSTGEKVEHPRELEASAVRLASVQRGINRKKVGRLQEKIARQRRDRNHKLSRRLVSKNAIICFSKDNIRGVAHKFGKSVASSSHGQLRQMLAYKCRTGGREYIEVEPRNSTRTCSTCLAPTGPTGWEGLAVRQWTCENCGSSHDRDVNAAINTLIVGAGDGPRMLQREDLTVQRLETSAN